MAGFVDLNASVSASSSATTGSSFGGFSGIFGDFNVGKNAGASGIPPWLPLALAALLLVGAVVYFVRKN